MERTKIAVKDNKPHILSNDPSITAWGWVVLSYNSKIVDSGCIKTKTEGKKRRIRKGDEDVHRTGEIVQTLFDIIKKYNITFMVSELPHGSQNAAAAKMIGICVGVVVGLSYSLNVPVEWYSEADSKKCALGKQSAEKIEMINAMNKVYNVPITGKPKPKAPWSGIQYIDEAVADALGVHNVAIHESATLKFLNK